MSKVLDDLTKCLDYLGIESIRVTIGNPLNGGLPAEVVMVGHQGKNFLFLFCEYGEPHPISREWMGQVTIISSVEQCLEALSLRQPRPKLVLRPVSISKRKVWNNSNIFLKKS